MNSFYTQSELQEIGFLSCGDNVLISKKASIYSPEKITIGDNVRVDDFCILSGKITIGSYIHIAAYTALYGGSKGIKIADFANISSKVSIYAISDDYTGSTMTNPLVPEKFKNVTDEEVIIEKHVIIGSGSVILPGIKLAEGSAFGAMSLINHDSINWTINAGIPFRKIKDRSKELLKLEKEFRSENL